jgi:hypothetical protein
MKAARKVNQMKTTTAYDMLMIKRKFCTVIVTSLLLSAIPMDFSTASAADCGKGNAAQKAACQSQSSKSTTDKVQEVSGANANDQRSAGQAAQVGPNAKTGAQTRNERARTWTKPTATDCVRGQTTLHLTDKVATCPQGFLKK